MRQSAPQPLSNLEIIQPGSLIAILGGGQLGRMTAMAARTMGYRVRVMDPEADCPASQVADEVITGRWDDVDAAHRLAEGADVVTLEIEQIGIDALEQVARFAPLRPGVEPLRIIQDKTLQKPWLAEHGVPVGAFRVATSYTELAEAAAELGGDVYVKTGRGGYDGRGQVRMRTADSAEAEKTWNALGGRPCVVEQALDLDFEISVMAARNALGDLKSFPSARNHHENQILAWSVLPSGISDGKELHAQGVAEAIIAKLDLVGLVCVEIFVTRDGAVLVNELAPRPHNSYHQSERGCTTSQFEQHIRAVCNLPLGDTSLISPCAIANLLGDVWVDGKSAPNFSAALAVEGVRLHLYEKKEPRRGRKMGHLSSVGASAEEAIARVLEAKGRL